jgi:CDP-diacylglycerol--serine O-phosphatidyltransferase
MKFKGIVPNTFTALNLLCGALACILIVEGEVYHACLFMGLGAFFDFFDGFFARLLNVAGELGKQLDSLADMVSFGLAPGLLAMHLLKSSENQFVPYLGLLIVVASAYRLAKFNIDTRQTTGFIGVPTPANSIFWIGLVLWQLPNSNFGFLLENVWIIIILIPLFSYLLISEFPLISLKFKSFAWGENKAKYSLLLGSCVLFSILRFDALPFVVLLYLIISIVDKQVNKA